MPKMSQIYSKSSFDRFGDDLSEEIISYLSLEDKIKFEAISRQFKEIVYRKQYDLVIDFEKNIFSPIKGSDQMEKRFIDMQAFESVLKKCQNITFIDINYCKFFEDSESFDQIMASIIEICNNLTEIEYDFSHNSWQTIEKFFNKFGPNLKQIKLFDNQLLTNRKFILNSCHNLKELKIFRLSHIFDQTTDEILVQNLKKLEFNYTTEDSNRIEKFVDKQKNSLESIDIRVNSGCDGDSIDVLMKQLANLFKLRHLKIIFSLDLIIGRYFIGLFQQIGIKCLKLKSLELTLISESIDINSEVFQSMKYFKELKRLDLTLNSKSMDVSNDGLNLRSKSLRECQYLTHLTLNGLQIEDQFFRYVDINLKRLQYLNVSDANITSNAIRLLSEVPNLLTIVFNTIGSKQLDESVIYYLVRKCTKIKSIKWNNRKDRPLVLGDTAISQLRQLKSQ